MEDNHKVQRIAWPVVILGMLALTGCREPDVIFGQRWMSVKDKRIRVEVAITPAQQERGLKFRRRLPEDEGMIFTYSRPVSHAFWMKDTRIALSIAFIDSRGQIADIQNMTPGDDKNLHFSPVPFQYALEMNSGWFSRNGVGVGDRVSLE